MKRLPRFGLPHAVVVSMALLEVLADSARAAAQQPQTPSLEGVREAREEANRQAAEQARAVLAIGEANGLTAADASRMAVETSPRLDAARASTASAHAAVNDALFSMLPDIRANASANHLGRIGSNTPLEQGIQNPALVQSQINATTDPNARSAMQAMYDQIQTSSSTSTPVPNRRYSVDGTASYPVLNALIAGLPTYRAAGKQEQANRIRETTELEAVMQEARETYYEFGRALATVRIAEQQIESARANLETIRSQERGGAATAADVAVLETELARQVVNLARAEGERERVGATLAALLTRGDIGDFRPSFAEDLSTPIPGPEGGFEALFEEAVVHRTELAMFREQVSAGRDQLRAASLRRLPELQATFGGTFANPNLIYFPWEPTWRGNWTVGLTLSWSLQNFMRAQATLLRTNAQIASLLAEQERMLDSVRVEVATAIATMLAAQRAYDAALTGVAAAAEVFRTKQVELHVGTAISSDLILAQTRLTAAQADLVNAAIDLRIARVRLDRSLGRYASSDLAEENRHRYR